MSSLERPWELLHALAALGYAHVYWNACSQPGMIGNWGCALISKIRPMYVRAGLGLDGTDPQGRTLTARFTDATIIFTYTPCSRPGEAEHAGRAAYDADMCAHHVKESLVQHTYGF